MGIQKKIKYKRKWKGGRPPICKCWRKIKYFHNAVGTPSESARKPAKQHLLFYRGQQKSWGYPRFADISAKSICFYALLNL